jgi:putative endonuclease
MAGPEPVEGQAMPCASATKVGFHSNDFARRMHYVYILQCRGGSYYVGMTQNVSSRLDVHSAGEGPAFTARRRPVRLVYQEAFATLDEAIRRERQLKGWSRAKKEALFSGNRERLAELAACRGTRP